MFEIHLSASAEKTYQKLDPNLRERIDRVFIELESGNIQSPHVCALHGPYKGYHRFRLGDWRIIFQIDRVVQRISIAAISTRGDAYKK